MKKFTIDDQKKMDINIIPTGGLCNRLRVVFSYLRIAEQYNHCLNIYWEADDACPGHFLDVFNPVENIKFLIKKPTDVLYQGSNTCPDIAVNKNMYQKLQPKDNISITVSRLSNIKYDAVHIRRTDHVALANKKSRYTPESIFQNFIEQSKHIVYLSCDNFDTQTEYVNRYGNKIFVHKMINPPDEKTKRLRQTSLEDAVVDLFVCIKSQSFLGTDYSSYSGLISCLR